MGSQVLIVFLLPLLGIFPAFVMGSYSWRPDGRELEKQAMEGALGLLECPVFEYGSQQHVTWTKNGVDVSRLDARFSVNQRSGALRIHRAQFLDSGRYTCGVRGRNNITHSRDTLLHVVSYPKITLTQNATVARNTTAALLCKVESVPVSHITWKKHHADITPGTALKASDAGGIPGAIAHTSQNEGTPSVTVSQLHFPSVQPQHAGLYVCLGANTPGTAMATLSLRVMYAPITIVHERTIVGWPDNVPDLHMSFKADPRPKVTCTHTPLFEFERAPQRVMINDVNNTESNVLEDVVMEEVKSHWKVIEVTEGEITNITIQLFPAYASHSESVFGTYSCVAYNSAGEVTGTIELQEGRVPHPPEVTIDSQKPTWMVLRLRMPADMGLPPADRIIARYQDMSGDGGEVVEFDKAVTFRASNSTQHWNLTGLNPGHDYRISLRLANPIAHSNYTVLHTKMPLYAPPEAVQFVSDPQGSNSRMYVLSWIPPATHGSSLTGYSLTYIPVSVLDGPNGPQIMDVAGAEHHVKVQSDSKFIVISGLQSGTYYRATMQAHSLVGDSLLSTFLFTTSNQSDAEHSPKASGNGGNVPYYRLPGDSHESQVLVEHSRDSATGPNAHSSATSLSHSTLLASCMTSCLSLISSTSCVSSSLTRVLSSCFSSSPSFVDFVLVVSHWRVWCTLMTIMVVVNLV